MAPKMAPIQKPKSPQAVDKNGAPGQIRTADLLVRSQTYKPYVVDKSSRILTTTTVSAPRSALIEQAIEQAEQQKQREGHG
jgi:hypothetical protein